MSVTAVAVASLGLVALPFRVVAGAGVLFAAALIHPLAGISLAGCAIVGSKLRSIRQARSRSRDTEVDSVLAVELVGLGVTAGLPFRNAARMTADQIGGAVGAEISLGLRAMEAGQQPVLESADVRSVFTVAELSERSGISLAAELNAVARERRRQDEAATRERLAKLPVKMLFPLAFLILPGFVLLTVVPPLVSGLSRLSL